MIRCGLRSSFPSEPHRSSFGAEGWQSERKPQLIIYKVVRSASVTCY